MRLSTTHRLRLGYDTAKVDVSGEEIRDTFLGVRQPPLTSDEAHHKQSRLPVYDVATTWSTRDDFLDQAELRLAAMLRTDKATSLTVGGHPV
jgi:hypothetical protein